MTDQALPSAVAEWEDSGRYITHDGHRIFVLDTNSHPGRTIFILHGFPSSSFDWHLVVPELAKQARVVTFDFLGFGLSDKPDQHYSLFEQADVAETVAADCGIEECVLVSHDMGDTVAAELLKRSTEGKLSFKIGRAILTNGSIFMHLVQLSAGQLFLLELPDERLSEPMQIDGLTPGLRATFSTDNSPPDDELQAMVELIQHNGGDQLLPRTVRYIEERRANQERWTAGLVDYPGPLTALWGEQDPIAVLPMPHHLKELRPETEVVTWPDVSHWPSIEVPERVTEAILARL
ncbi:MAG: alpha/beta hydrolase [Actinomycetota bacterium]